METIYKTVKSSDKRVYFRQIRCVVVIFFPVHITIKGSRCLYASQRYNRFKAWIMNELIVKGKITVEFICKRQMLPELVTVKESLRCNMRNWKWKQWKYYTSLVYECFSNSHLHRIRNMLYIFKTVASNLICS